MSITGSDSRIQSAYGVHCLVFLALVISSAHAAGSLRVATTESSAITSGFRMTIRKLNIYFAGTPPSRVSPSLMHFSRKLQAECTEYERETVERGKIVCKPVACEVVRGEGSTFDDEVSQPKKKGKKSISPMILRTFAGKSLYGSAG